MSGVPKINKRRVSKWQWSEKVGYATIKHGESRTMVNLYNGNALLIFVHEYDGLYELYAFFADEEHMANCLGLTKGYSNIFIDGSSEIEEITLTTKCRKLDKIVKAFTKAYKNHRIDIHIITGTE